MLRETHIVLVGLMGCGKSTIGRHLARALDLPFLDADKEIEAAAGCSVRDIFDLYGEAAFRDGERKVITRLLQGEPAVIATGGGAWMNPDIRAECAEQAVTVWLKTPLAVLVGRTEGRTHRPLLVNRDSAAVLSDLMKARDPVYATADVIVETCQEAPAKTTRRVLDALRAHVEDN